MGKGGCRRQATPTIDMEHLEDLLRDQVRREGHSQAFQFGKYLSISKTQAIHAGALLAQEDFLLKLMAVNDGLLFNYKDLKEGFTQVCRAFPGLKECFDVEMRPTLAGKLAESTMTMCTHMRRLRVPQKFQEACSCLSDWQVQKLEGLRAAFGGDTGKGPKEKSGASGSKAKKEQKESTEDEEGSFETQDLLDLEVPKTPGKDGTSLLDAALQVSPVPARKQNLKAAMGLKKPAAAGSFKKPASKISKENNRKGKIAKAKVIKDKVDYKEAQMRLMPYRKTTAVAVVAKGVGQLFQVVTFKDVEKKSKAARKLMEMLKKGSSLADVLAAKEKVAK